jgi:hypothetical protein
MKISLHAGDKSELSETGSIFWLNPSVAHHFLTYMSNPDPLSYYIHIAKAE